MNSEKQIQELLSQGYIKVGSKSYCTYWKREDHTIAVWNDVDEITTPNIETKGNKMYILIEEREQYDPCSGNVNYKHDNIGISGSLGDLLEYCRENYSLSDADYKELCEYMAVDDVYDKYRCSVNLIINVVNYI